MSSPKGVGASSIGSSDAMDDDHHIGKVESEWSGVVWLEEMQTEDPMMLMQFHY